MLIFPVLIFAKRSTLVLSDAVPYVTEYFDQLLTQLSWSFHRVAVALSESGVNIPTLCHRELKGSQLERDDFCVISIICIKRK